ncbi:MAG: hypothetical protein FJ265_18735, partial [Planctomycetes bacterium]|nr:hypothetical protein [Planctomycetota bacterium]
MIRSTSSAGRSAEPGTTTAKVRRAGHDDRERVDVAVLVERHQGARQEPGRAQLQQRFVGVLLAPRQQQQVAGAAQGLVGQPRRDQRRDLGGPEFRLGLADLDRELLLEQLGLAVRRQ